MKLEQTSYSVDNVIQLKESVNDFLRQRCHEERTTELNEKIQGGILSDIRYSWLAKGPKLEVLHTKSGAKVAAWCFRAQHDFDTSVTCVTDLANAHGRAPLLVVGLECEITGGMVCVFDVGTSRVIRAIQIDDKVTAIEVVSGGYDSSLPGVLRALDGVIAVGTAKGKVLLIDLCRQICEEAISNNGNDSIRDEINSCHLIPLSYQDLRNLETHKEKSLNKGDHLCLQLNESSTTDVHFSLFGPSGEVRLRANMSEVIISSLHFSCALGSLLVGYNFGAWQLYNLLTSPCPVLEYTSPMYEDCIPVGHFAVQEPCDDPRAFCYVWVAYSVQDAGDAGTSIAVMYALTYDTKEYLEGYGMLYQDLTACSVRFQMELAQIIGGTSKNTGARCLTLRSYTRPITTDSPDERLALCTLVWTCWDSSTATDTTYLALFDLNQWYKEQMPGQPRVQHEDNERYMTCVSLTDLMADTTVAAKQNCEVLDIRVDPQSVSPFICAQRLEEHYYPSALALRLVCATGRQLVWVRSAGAQRYLLMQLELAGSLCLLQPAELYHRCVALGLCPAHQDLVASPTSTQQRAFVMSVALEHQLVRWLCCCARDWANGSQASAGCTLDSLLDWAWQRANTLKFNADNLCVPLFDHTGVRLDHNALLQLNHAACQLKHLTTLFDTVVHCCDVYFTEQDLEDIRYQWNSLQMISIYLEVLQWLLNVGLLPECPLSMYPRPDESERMSAPYPVDSLARFYAQRRQELCGDDNQHQESLLFIDQLVERECGGSILSKQWKCDGGNGLYPPPSLQALLRTYLVEDIEITHKHCLFIYVFLDLAMTLDQSRYKSIITHLIKFPAVFKLSPSIIKMTQAFWQLDHGDFSTAMAQLLDPAVASDDLKPWHHRIVLKALLLQGQHQHALLYQQVRKPPVSSVHDICIVITLLIVNDLLQEAFHFQRQNRSVYNEKEILKHFFTVSDKMNHLPVILQLPLTSSEENSFINYLRSNPGETNQNLLVIYYLQRDRYAEAFDINDKLNHSATLAGVNQDAVKQGLLGQQDRNFRNVIVSGFKKTLPKVTQTLLDYMKNQKRQESAWKNEEQRLVPMSVFVHDTQEQAKYKSTLIQASFHKAKETWTHVQDNTTPFISTPKIATSTDKANKTPLIYAIVMQPDCQTEVDPELEATPAKRMRLSPRQPISTNTMMNNSTLQRTYHRVSTSSVPGAVDSPSLALLDTPIVKRKSYREHALARDGYSPAPSVVGTPTSILKVRSFIRKSLSPDVGGDARGTSTTPEVFDTDNHEMDSDSGITPLDNTTANVIKSIGLNISSSSFTNQRRRSPLGVSPRRPIQRTPRPAVHFEDLGRPNSRSSDGSATDTSTNSKQHLEVRIDVHREQTPENDTVPSSKDSSRSTEDVFYSPNASFSDKSANVTMEVDQELEENTSTESRRSSLKRKANDTSIKSRRSYKSVTPVKVQVEARNIRESLRSRDSLLNSDESVRSKDLSLKSDKSSDLGDSLLKSSPKATSVKSRDSISKPVEASPSAIKQDTPRKSEVFPKLGGRRSLSRQVLEHNTLAKVMQLPKVQTRLSMSKVSPLENIDQHTVGVEVSYSKTVTSMVKKSSDSVAEETCDKSTVEMKNVFTTEKDSDSSAQVIKHVHNESSSKSSVKKVTEVLDENSSEEINNFSEYNRESGSHVLSFSSDINDSMFQSQYETSEQQNETDSFINTSGSTEAEEKQNIDEIEESRNETNEMINISMEDADVEINKNKNANLTQTFFKDISTIIVESDESEAEEQMETCEYIPTKISSTNISSDNKETKEERQESIKITEQHENLNLDEHSKDSSEDLEKVSDQSEDSNENVIVEAEIHESVSRDESTASSNVDNENNEEEEETNVLVPSSEEESSEEEKVSNQEEEEDEEEEEEEQEVNEENSEENESRHEEQSEVTSEDNSSRSSDVIEIKSSSEESLEELKINHPRETVEYEKENNENEESERESDSESNHEDDANVLEQNIETLEEIAEEKIIKPETVYEEDPDMETEIIETEQAIVNIESIEPEVLLEVEDIQDVEQNSTENIVEVEEVQQEIIQDVEESLELPEDIRLEIEECIRDDEECIQEGEQISLQKDSDKELNQAVIEETLKVDITDKENEEISKLKPESSTDTSKNISQDCLEIMNFSQTQEELHQTDILCDENLVKDTVIQKMVMEENVIIEDNPFTQDESCVPSRRSKRINSQQDNKNTEEKPEPVKAGIHMSTRRRSMSVDIEETPVEEISSKLPPRSTRRRSASVDIEAKSDLVNVSSKPTLRASTRTRSASVDVEENLKPTARPSTRKRSTSVDIEAKSNPVEDESSKAATRTLRKRSTSVDIEVNPKPASRTSTRKHSSNVDVEEETVKPATRTRKRSTSIDIEEESAKPRTPRKKRSTSEEPIAEEPPKRSTRASSVVNLPVIKEEVQPSRRTTRASSVDVESTTSQRSKRGSSLEPKQSSSPARRGKKRSIQTDAITEETESVTSEQEKQTALEDIPDKIEDYSATHRLTRRQKMIMQKSIELQEMKKLQPAEVKPRVADIDPIKLLDKESFAGSPDLEERHNRSSSPASSVGTTSSVATRLTSEMSTPSRSGSRRASQNTTPRTPRRSSRTASKDTPPDDASSVRSVPVVQLDRIEVTRHRSLSPSAMLAESAATTPRSRRKSTRKSILPVQTDLTKISEEISADLPHASSEELKTAAKDERPKRGRPKKIDSEKRQSSQSPGSQASETNSAKHVRTTSYKPLEEYVGKYSGFESRKTYRVKKLSRK